MSEIQFFSAGARLGLIYSYCISRRAGANPNQIDELKKIETHLDGLKDNILSATLSNIPLINDCLDAYFSQINAVFEHEQ